MFERAAGLKFSKFDTGKVHANVFLSNKNYFLILNLVGKKNTFRDFFLKRTISGKNKTRCIVWKNSRFKILHFADSKQGTSQRFIWQKNICLFCI